MKFVKLKELFLRRETSETVFLTFYSPFLTSTYLTGHVVATTFCRSHYWAVLLALRFPISKLFGNLEIALKLPIWLSVWNPPMRHF